MIASDKTMSYINDLPARLLDSPLDFIYADHLRQRVVAQLLHKVAEGRGSQEEIENLRQYLSHNFALHIADEEHGLFPLLRERCTQEDNIEKLLDRLGRDHKGDESMNDHVLKDLSQAVSGGELDDETQKRLHKFADHIKQHLVLENGVLLPIARVRLEEADLRNLSKNLRRRRAL